MGRVYSHDLRERVITAIVLGLLARYAAARFGVGIAPAIGWARRARETGVRKARRQGRPPDFVGLIRLARSGWLRKRLLPRKKGVRAHSRALRNLSDWLTPLDDLRHRIALEILTETASRRPRLLASKLGKKASTKLGAIHRLQGSDGFSSATS